MQPEDGESVVGVLALQGGFAAHLIMLKKLGISARAVRSVQELKRCDALIIPGGESTTISHLLDTLKLTEPLQDFAKQKPVLGTCAGAILMAHEVEDHSVTPLKLIDMTVKRNAMGRQKNSFIGTVDFQGQNLEAFFIRAPQITSVGPDVTLLAHHKNSPVLVRQAPNLFAATFHPELTHDLTVHSLFIHAIEEGKAYA